MAPSKRNPAGQGGARKGDQVGQPITGEDAPSHSTRQADERVVAVYNGLDHLGNICIGRTIRGVTPSGREIGVFPTEAEARKAIVLAAFGMAAR